MGQRRMPLVVVSNFVELVHTEQKSLRTAATSWAGLQGDTDDDRLSPSYDRIEQAQGFKRNSKGARPIRQKAI